MPVTADEMIQSILHPFVEAMGEAKITPRLLAAKLREELDAKETKFFQFQGSVVSKRDVIAWGVRQAARMDAQKLLGAYPSEKHELEISSPVLFGQIPDDERQMILESNRMIQKALEARLAKEKRRRVKAKG